MDTIIRTKIARRTRIKHGIRRRIRGTAECPRLSVYRSNNEIYAQLIDDVSGRTLAAASTFAGEGKATTGSPVEKANAIGKILATNAKAANISKVVFDRNGYLYHGRVKSLAEGAREAGLIF